MKNLWLSKLIKIKLFHRSLFILFFLFSSLFILFFLFSSLFILSFLIKTLTSQMQDQDHILQVMKEASSILAILSKNNTYLVGFHRKQIWDIAKTGLKVRWIQSFDVTLFQNNLLAVYGSLSIFYKIAIILLYFFRRFIPTTTTQTNSVHWLLKSLW